MKGKKKYTKNGIIRLLLSFFSFLLQVIWLLVLGTYLNRFSTVIAVSINILSLLFVIYVYNKQNSSTTFKLPWIMLILVFPIIGIVLYILCGKNIYTDKQKQRYKNVKDKIHNKQIESKDIISEIAYMSKSVSNQFNYLSKCCNFPVYRNTTCEFFSEAETGFKSQLEDLKKAKKFIFMEYHAIEQNSKAFTDLLEILKEKVNEGVEVRILYDDVGSIGFVNLGFVKYVQSFGIKCKVFNPVFPLIRLFMNNRDHRKITVIDGEIGYTGGYNWADEYFGYKPAYGKWKDTGLRFEGPAVNSLTEMFLEMWINPKKDKIEGRDFYKFDEYQMLGTDGYIAPYADVPLDEEFVGENVYMNMIKSATDYVYITTPYIILDDEMKRELIQAVKRGVNVCIVTPGIPDKKIVYRITRSFYGELVRAGVKIFEYTPGFIHSKQVVVDDIIAAVGTINMDFRSFYHHFENGVLLYKSRCISDIKNDFNQIFLISRNVTEKYKDKKYRRISLFDSFLRLFSSLM